MQSKSIPTPSSDTVALAFYTRGYSQLKAVWVHGGHDVNAGGIQEAADGGVSTVAAHQVVYEVQQDFPADGLLAQSLVEYKKGRLLKGEIVLDIIPLGGAVIWQ